MTWNEDSFEWHGLVVEYEFDEVDPEDGSQEIVITKVLTDNSYDIFDLLNGTGESILLARATEHLSGKDARDQATLEEDRFERERIKA